MSRSLRAGLRLAGEGAQAARKCSACRQTTLSRMPARTALSIPAIRHFGSSSSSWAEVKSGPVLSQTNQITLRRFWKTVHIKEETDGFQVTLDHRNLKTPAGTKLVLPKDRRLLALLIANEWENQEEILKQHALPLTSLASRAIDGMQDPKIRPGVIEALLDYLETDTICYPEEKPESLVKSQKESWGPLFALMKAKYGVELAEAEGFSPARQSQQTVEVLRGLVEDMDHWELAGEFTDCAPRSALIAAFERAVYASKSFVIALALCKGHLTANEASDAAQVEVRDQIRRWGEVEDTHDVDYQDIRRALGSVACILVKA